MTGAGNAVEGRGGWTVGGPGGSPGPRHRAGRPVGDRSAPIGSGPTGTRAPDNRLRLLPAFLPLGGWDAGTSRRRWRALNRPRGAGVGSSGREEAPQAPRCPPILHLPPPPGARAGLASTASSASRHRIRHREAAARRRGRAPGAAAARHHGEVRRGRDGEWDPAAPRPGAGARALALSRSLPDGPRGSADPPGVGWPRRSRRRAPPGVGAGPRGAARPRPTARPLPAQPSVRRGGRSPAATPGTGAPRPPARPRPANRVRRTGADPPRRRPRRGPGTPRW